VGFNKDTLDFILKIGWLIVGLLLIADFQL